MRGSIYVGAEKPVQIPVGCGKTVGIVGREPVSQCGQGVDVVRRVSGLVYGEFQL